MNDELEQMLKANKARADEVRAELTISATDRWLSERPDIVMQPREFNRWLARQPEQSEIELTQPERPFSHEGTTGQRVTEEADVEVLIDHCVNEKLAQYHSAPDMRPVTREVLRGLVTGIRAEIVEQVGQLRADIEIQKAHAGERGEVIDLPALPLRSQRRG
ncbi:hypothetical protein [Bradyrhizobium sp. F1.13.3]|uniref:hypothetical protein n=1 Tax=Bradyrhizobium sp. F1.13.3 TaxID=3156351 RepID=UPI00339168B5